MARKITLFELHFDDAHFGPTFGDSDDEGHEATPESGDADVKEYESDEYESDEYDATTDAPSGSRARRVVATVALIAVATVVGRRLVRRFRGADGDDGDDVEFDDVEAADEPVAQ